RAMPEGDTILRAARALHTALAGKIVRGFSSSKLPRARLVGRTIVAVEAKGKHLLVRLDDGRVLHSHMRMSGSWHLYRTGERWQLPRHRARAVLMFGDREAVCFAAPVLELVRDAGAAVAHLGPDILDDDLPLDRVVARARSVGPV